MNNKVRVGIGSFASFKRSFTETDLRTFATFLQDKDPLEFKKDAFAHLGLDQIFVYGMMPTSLFSKLYLSTFISPIYLSQSVNFKAPIYLNEEVEIKLVVTELETTKSNMIKCSMESTVTKIEKNILAVTGSGLLLLKPETVELIK